MGLSHENVVPWSVLQAPESCAAAFVQAYLEGDAHIEDTRRVIDASSASRSLLQQLQALLLSWGIISTYSDTIEPRGKHTQEYGRLVISGKDASLLMQEIGVTSDRGKRFDETRRDHSNLDYVPYVRELISGIRQERARGGWYETDTGECIHTSLTWGGARPNRANMKVAADSLDKLSANYAKLADQLRYLSDLPYYFDEVVCVEDAGEAPTFDLTNCKSQYTANGIVVHNCDAWIYWEINLGSPSTKFFHGKARHYPPFSFELWFDGARSRFVEHAALGWRCPRCWNLTDEPSAEEGDPEKHCKQFFEKKDGKRACPGTTATFIKGGIKKRRRVPATLVDERVLLRDRAEEALEEHLRHTSELEADRDALKVRKRRRGRNRNQDREV